MGEHHSLPPHFCEMSYLSKADGSVFYTQGETAVLVGVFGPVQVMMKNERIEGATIEVTYKSKSGQSGVDDRLKELTINGVCESAIMSALHPRTGITITIQEMQSHGGLLSACVNACCMACMDAGISMKYLFAAVDCGVRSNGDIVVGLDDKQDDIVGDVMYVFDSKNGGVLASESHGTISSQQLQTALAIAKDVSAKLFDFYRNAIKKKFSKVVLPS